MRMHTWVELDLQALADNIGALCAALAGRSEIIFVVKANAYGHGLAPVARSAWANGVRRYAVVHIDEAQALRYLLPDADILIVGVLDAADAVQAVRANIVPVIVSAEHARALGAKAASANLRLRCHAKIDTGMGRLGFPWETAAETIAGLAGEPGLAIEGLCSHFASSDSHDRTFAETQIGRFRRVIEECRSRGLPPGYCHIANSGAVLGDAGWDFDGVRAGILLYGYGRHPAPARELRTRPFLAWKTRVVMVKPVPAGFPVSYDSTHVTARPTHIATLDVGYADGYSRLLGNRGSVLIRGRHRPVVGRVTMNLTTVDLGPERDAAEGDEAVLIGADGAESIWADEVAGWRGTISYEVLTNIRTEDRRLIIPPARRQ